MKNKKNTHVKALEKSEVCLNLCIFMVYTILMSVIAAFHEPWLDEAQAWVIARDESMKNIIFKIPHAEGHSPLWYLWCALFAKTGVPYSIGLPAACISVMAVSVLIFLFKAPFNKYVKIFLPFTYYFFYQNGVISREYCFSVLAFVLLSCVWNDKWNKPVKTALSMVLLCFSSPYGLVFAFGLGVIWLWSFIKGIRKKSSDIILNKKNIIAALIILIICAGLLVLDLIPVAHTTALNVKADNPLPVRLLYMFFVSVPDTLLTSVFTDDMYLKICEYQPSVMGICAVIGIIMYLYVFILIPKSRGHRIEFILPYGIYAVFAANVYYSTHHLCMTAAFFLFWCWICGDRHMPAAKTVKAGKGEKAAMSTQTAENIEAVVISQHEKVTGTVMASQTVKAIGTVKGTKNTKATQTAKDTEAAKARRTSKVTESKKAAMSEKSTGKSGREVLRDKLKKLAPVFAAVCIAVPFFWNTSACIKEIRTNYSTSKEYTEFIKEKGLSDAKIFMSVDMVKKKGGRNLPELSDSPLPILTAYFSKKNNIYKFNIHGRDIQYVYPVEESVKDDENTLKEWRNAGYPDIVIGEVNISEIFGDSEAFDTSGSEQGSSTDPESEGKNSRKDGSRTSEEKNKESKETQETTRTTPEYICVWVGKAAKIYKNFQVLPPIASAKKVYMRKDLAQEKGIRQVHWERMK